MAFTKITNAGFGLTTGTLVGVAASFSSTVSVGGTLTYEDVTNVDSVGLITARSGISITGGDLTVPDAIIHTGDTNTRIRFPAADTFSVETAGNERLRVSSGGDMGLGTASPTARLDVRRDDADGLIAEFHQSSGYGINIKSSQTVATIQAEANQALTLETGSSATERLRILSNGLIGIGTDNPDNFNGNADDLVISGAGHQGLTIKSGAAHDGSIMFNDTNDANQRGIIRYIHTSDAMAFHTSVGESLRIDSSGNLGLGEDSPQKRLHVSTSGAGIQEVQWLNNAQAVGADVGSALVFTGTSSNNGLARIQGAFQGSGASDGGYITFDTRAQTSGTLTERLRIDRSGNMGLGTNSPTDHNSFTRIADINGSGGGALYCRTNGSSTNVGIFGQSGSDVYVINKATGNIRFNVADAEKMRIHAAGHGEFNSGAITRVVVGSDVSLSGSSQTVTGIPSWATKITIILYRASLDGGTDYLVQLRVGSSDISSNYNSISTNHTGATERTSTSGFIIVNTNAGHKTSGHMVIERVGTDNKWVATHMMLQDSGPAPRMGAGDLSNYSGTIDGIKIKDTGNNSFDNGTITVIAEA